MDDAHAKVGGIDAIRKRFDNHPLQIRMPFWLSFFVSGVRNSDGEPFDFPSSVALIHFRDGKIDHYQDYPNTLGITKAVGLLNQFAETLKS